MKQIRLFAALFIVALVVTSCITWVNDEDGNTRGGKRLVKITSGGDGDINLFYKDGKIVEIVDTYENLYITYKGKIVTMEGMGEFILQLNNDGFVESGKLYFGDVYEFKFDYSNGYLAKCTCYSTTTNETTITVNIKYDNNGNLLTASTSFIDDYPIREYKYEYTYTSSNYTSKGINVFFLEDCFGQHNGYPYSIFQLYYAGLLGKLPKKLVSKAEFKGDNSSYTDYCLSRTYDYKFDNDGYVSIVSKTEKHVNSVGSSYPFDVFFTYE